MNIDTLASTITIAGRRFPAACAICPPYEGDEDPEVERMLGGPARPTVGSDKGKLSYQVMIPCENGVLVVVEWFETHPESFEIVLDARTCALSCQEPDRPLWLPHLVGIANSQITLPPRLAASPFHHWWSGAYPDWTIELIDRVSVMPFIQPEGPPVRLITLAEAERLLPRPRVPIGRGDGL
jgi:hypothetical protein